jgi:solute carrier family 25 phosphate transporter 23/24/25/41
MPYSAVQFGTYESAKSYLSSFTDKGQGHLGTPSKLLAGSLAGITSVCSTYPLDLVRARISIADARRSSSSKTRQLAFFNSLGTAWKKELR